MNILGIAGVSVFLLLSCAPSGTAAPNKDTGGEVALAAPVPAAGGGLRSLGLTVFPEPQPLPPIKVATPDGGTLDMEDFKGSYVFLNFWATWCPPCRAEMPSMEVLHKELKDEPFKIAAISVGEKTETVRSFLKDNPYTFSIGLDPENRLGPIFAGRGIPTTYIIDPQGRAIAGMIGGRQWDDPSTVEIFRALIGGKL